MRSCEEQLTQGQTQEIQLGLLGDGANVKENHIIIFKICSFLFYFIYFKHFQVWRGLQHPQPCTWVRSRTHLVVIISFQRDDYSIPHCGSSPLIFLFTTHDTKALSRNPRNYPLKLATFYSYTTKGPKPINLTSGFTEL